MHEYFQRRYVAEDITVSVAGNFSWPEFVKLLEKHAAPGRRQGSSQETCPPPPANASFQVVPKAKVNQEHVFMITPGPSAKSPDALRRRHPGHVLGDDSGSRLHWALIDPGLADSADMSFHEYDGRAPTSAP